MLRTLAELAPLAAWIEALAVVVAAAAAIVTAILAIRKYLSEEHITPTRSRIDVFSTPKQTTELRATLGGLELRVYDVRPGRAGRQWRLGREEVERVLRTRDFRAKPESRDPRFGVFTIGPRKNWYYSKRLYPSSEELEKDIESLLRQVVSGDVGD